MSWLGILKLQQRIVLLEVKWLSIYQVCCCIWSFLHNEHSISFVNVFHIVVDNVLLVFFRQSSQVGDMDSKSGWGDIVIVLGSLIKAFTESCLTKVVRFFHQDMKVGTIGRRQLTGSNSRNLGFVSAVVVVWVASFRQTSVVGVISLLGNDCIYSFNGKRFTNRFFQVYDDWMSRHKAEVVKKVCKNIGGNHRSISVFGIISQGYLVFSCITDWVIFIYLRPIEVRLFSIYDGA